MRVPKQSLSWDTFVDVFDKIFWLAVAGMVTLASLVLHLANRMRRHPLKSLSSVLLTLGALSVSENPMKFSSRTIFLTACLFGALVYWSYNAILVSLLTVDSFILPIGSLEEYLLKSGDYQIASVKGTAVEQYFSEATPTTNPIAYEIFEKSMKDNPKASLSNSASVANSALLDDDRLIFFWESDGGKIALDDYPCRITTAATSYFDNYVSFAFPKNSDLVGLFSEKILALKQSGQVEKVLDKYFGVKRRVTCSDKNFKEIKFENIFTAFLVLGVGVTSAWLVAFMELCLKRK